MRDYMIGGIIGIALTYLMWVDLGFLAWFLFVLIFGGLYLRERVGIRKYAGSFDGFYWKGADDDE